MNFKNTLHKQLLFREKVNSKKRLIHKSITKQKVKFLLKMIFVFRLMITITLYFLVIN